MRTGILTILAQSPGAHARIARIAAITYIKPMLQTEICPAHDVSRGAYDVVIPCFNRERTVTQAVDSVLAQSPTPSRIILVDDGSTDRTADVLRALEERHPTVTAILLPRNVGASAARNGAGRRSAADEGAGTGAPERSGPGMCTVYLTTTSPFMSTRAAVKVVSVLRTTHAPSVRDAAITSTAPPGASSVSVSVKADPVGTAICTWSGTPKAVSAQPGLPTSRRSTWP